MSVEGQVDEIFFFGHVIGALEHAVAVIEVVYDVSDATKVIIMSYSILCMNIRRYSSFQEDELEVEACELHAVKVDRLDLEKGDEFQVEACELLAVKADILDLENGDEWIVRG